MEFLFIFVDIIALLWDKDFSKAFLIMAAAVKLNQVHNDGYQKKYR